MLVLADLKELVGFFSYSREDDEDFGNSLSSLRDRLQRNLSAQLGRSVRLWQDKEAIPLGARWASQIESAIADES
jgi:hypothetical protein